MALSHYEQLERVLRAAIAEHIDKDSSAPCRLWAHTTTRNGGESLYPLFYKFGDKYKPRQLVYKWAHGSLRDDWAVFVTCGNSLCLNPAHLEQRPHQRTRRQRQLAYGIPGIDR